jgi:hypothetical protein
MTLPSIWPDPGSDKQFDAFLNKLLKQASSISQMGLVHDDGKTLYLYDQFGFSDAELDKRFYACLDMIKLFPPSLKINTPLDHLLQANNSAICLSSLGPGWYLVVIGNLNGIPGGFPALCSEYRKGVSAGDAKKKSAKTKTASAADSRIIGNADEFFVNPLGKDGN